MHNKNIVSTHEVKVNGELVTAYRIKLDANGNPRYVVHFLSLNVQPKDYGKIKGLSKYRAKWYGGGYVFQSYNIEQDLQHALGVVQAFYKEATQ